MPDWIERELAGCSLPDVRLDSRLARIVGQLSGPLGQSIPMACQDWANTKAAYRFFDNPRVDEAGILAGHFQATRERFDVTEDPVLVLHDTTEFSFQRESSTAIGVTTKTPTGHGGRARMHTVCGILMHASLVVTTDGLPLGLAAIKFWTRKKFKGANRLKRKINATRVPIEKKESVRWIQNLEQSSAALGAPGRLVHVGDRESDIYEFFCAAHAAGSHFLIRACVDRLAKDGNVTIEQVMEDVPIRGLHRIDVIDRDGVRSEAVLELRHRRIRVLPPIGKQDRYPALDLTVLRAVERGEPKDRDPIEWKLLTDLPIRSRHDAVGCLRWYALRWRIETFFKILKTACRPEWLRMRNAERLTNAIAVNCILAWRVFWMTMIGREAPGVSANLAFTQPEIEILDRLAPWRGGHSNTNGLAVRVTQLARLGGFLARTRDGPPGNLVIWRGLVRLTDILLGYAVGADSVGK